LFRFKGNRPSNRMAKWFHACFQPTRTPKGDLAVEVSGDLRNTSS
jgi:hypothetical protein